MIPMSDQQKRVIGAVAFVLATIVIAVLLYMFFFRSAPEQAVDVVDTGAEVTTPSTNGSGLTSSGGRTAVPAGETTEVETPEEPAAEPVRDDLSEVRNLASVFTERFGSFSTEADFANIVDLKVFMTSGMQAWADALVEEARAAGPSAVSYGITTRALIIDVSDIDAEGGTATATVTAQRLENSPGSTAYFEDLLLEFKKVDDAWKVDSAEWGEERLSP